MASTFKRFPDLPYELRRKIWERATHPSGYDGGLHHFFITASDSAIRNTMANLVFLDPGRQERVREYRHPIAAVPKFSDLQNKSPLVTSNWSAYFWDAGLWTACLESRRVMKQHYNYQQIRRTQKAFLRYFRRVSAEIYHSAALLIEHWDVPLMATVPQTGGEWQLVVNTYRDVFCLTLESWSRTIDWDKIVFDLYFTPDFPLHGCVRYIAMEFDDTWNINHPEDFIELLREDSPRGFLARGIHACTFEQADCFIWLIDRQTWPRKRTLDEPTIFYDCKKVYIETDFKDMIWYDMDDDECDQNAGVFYFILHELGKLCYLNQPGSTVWGQFEDWALEDFVGILTCKDFGSL
ncbi:hypothetical protein QQZ08_006425 [Neonectria magnoliae]|uniref:2EXR domain-containing protein n=1 Tax=Neonectria magnoliae TaxID=2732573 RepID=A0ABR1I0E2_9HYPO